MEFTQEQQAHIDSLVAKAKEEARQGLLTKEEFDSKLTAEVDRRVDTGIQKGLETQKAKWQKEFETQANLTAEEKALQKLKEQEDLLTQREREVLKKTNLAEAKDMLSTAGVPKVQYEKLLGVLVTEDEATTKASVQNFIDVFAETKLEIETKVKSELSHITPPTNGGKDTPVNKEDFNKMGYAEKLKLKTDNPDLYKKFMG